MIFEDGDQPSGDPLPSTVRDGVHALDFGMSGKCRQRRDASACDEVIPVVDHYKGTTGMGERHRVEPVQIIKSKD